MRKAVVIFCLLLSFSAQAKTGDGTVFFFSTELVQAHKETMALRITPASKLLAGLKAKDPSSPALAFVEDYAGFFECFIREEKKLYDNYLADNSKRIKTIKKSDASSPYHRFCHAELLVHRAILRFKFREYASGASEVREAYQLLQENIRLFPQFRAHYKSMGLIEVLVGTLPSGYSWVAFMLGMSGEIAQGMDRIELFLNSTGYEPEVEVMKEEALFIYAFLQLHILREKDKAWKMVEAGTRDYKKNLLKCYLRANIALQCRRNDEVIEILNNRPKGAQYISFYYLDYLLGITKLHRLDTDADKGFRSYVSNFQGENHIKDAYLKMAWHYLINGSLPGYQNYLVMVRRRGQTHIDEDKQAMREADEGITPVAGLVKARLLFDGGYLKRSLQMLDSIKPGALIHRKHQVELLYRKARVYDEMGNEAFAITWYEKTMEAGKDLPYYFAANSCLQLGLLYERKKMYSLARECFIACTKYPNKEYKVGIEQKAKAGLKRIGP